MWRDHTRNKRPGEAAQPFADARCCEDVKDCTMQCLCAVIVAVFVVGFATVRAVRLALVDFAFDDVTSFGVPVFVASTTFRATPILHSSVDARVSSVIVGVGGLRLGVVLPSINRCGHL